MSKPVTIPPSRETPELRPIGAGRTHPGNVRESNEDSLLTDPAQGLWAVADGMGGYGHGDLAADLVADALSGMRQKAGPARDLRSAVEGANEAIYGYARQSRIGLMGSTVVAALLQSGIGHIVWAGDSRAYLWRPSGLTRLTRDHSVVQDLIDRGSVAAEDAESHPHRHIITRAVGVRPSVEVEYIATPLALDERLLLCSDGLTCCVGEARISEIIDAGPDPSTISEALVEEALAEGAPDNVSVIVVALQPT